MELNSQAYYNNKFSLISGKVAVTKSLPNLTSSPDKPKIQPNSILQLAGYYADAIRHQAWLEWQNQCINKYCKLKLGSFSNDRHSLHVVCCWGTMVWIKQCLDIYSLGPWFPCDFHRDMGLIQMIKSIVTCKLGSAILQRYVASWCICSQHILCYVSSDWWSINTIQVVLIFNTAVNVGVEFAGLPCIIDQLSVYCCRCVQFV